MYLIRKSYVFSASHQLVALPREHPCSRLHGHNYTVRLECAGQQVNEYGFIVDYREITQRFGMLLASTYDHRHLNDVLTVPPTAENLARVLCEAARAMWPDCVRAVAVQETLTTWAEFRLPTTAAE